jgi:hypothetical protein
MRRHSGRGLGGGISLQIAFFVGFVSPFLGSAEVGQLYQRRSCSVRSAALLDCGACSACLS